MKGKYTVKIANRKVAYTLELERNITILTGESGIGKTSLARLVQNYEDAGKQSGVTIQCKAPCRSITSDDGWQSKLESIHNSIIFIDEGRRFLRTYEFAQAIEGCDNYFVIITRESLPQIPYSVHSVLTLRNTRRLRSKQYSRAYESFDFISHFSDAVHNSEFIFTEDSNAGFEAFEKLTEGTYCDCIPAGGKTKIASLLMEYEGKRIIVIADGAAFGSEMNNVYSYYKEYSDITTLYLPESFEWIVLKSGIVSDKRIGAILKHPWKYILSEEFKSWELFFSDLLIKTTAGTKLQYSKNKLAKAYLTSGNMRKIWKAIEQQEAAEKK